MGTVSKEIREQNKKLLEEYREASILRKREIENEVVTLNQGLVRTFLAKYLDKDLMVGSGKDADDVFQEALLAVLRAVQTYKTPSKAQFHTYAAKAVFNSIKNTTRRLKKDPLS